MAKGVRTMTPGEVFIQRINRLRQEARKNNGVLDLTMLPEERSAIEQQIGRKLTNREIVQGHLDRPEDRTFAQAMQDGNWRPVMPQQNSDPYSDAVREAEEAVRRDEYAKLSPNEQRLYHLKELQQKKLQEAASEAEYEARLADPRVATALAGLRELQNRAAFDPTWKQSETDAISRAIQQLETPGASLEEGFKLTDAVTGIEKSKRKALADAKTKAIADLQLQLAELGVESQTTSVSKAPAGSARAKADEAYEAWRQAAVADQDEATRIPLWDAWADAQVAADKEAAAANGATAE